MKTEIVKLDSIGLSAIKFGARFFGPITRTDSLFLCSPGLLLVISETHTLAVLGLSETMELNDLIQIQLNDIVIKLILPVSKLNLLLILSNDGILHYMDLRSMVIFRTHLIGNAFEISISASFQLDQIYLLALFNDDNDMTFLQVYHIHTMEMILKTNALKASCLVQNIDGTKSHDYAVVDHNPAENELRLFKLGSANSFRQLARLVDQEVDDLVVFKFCQDNVIDLDVYYKLRLENLVSKNGNLVDIISILELITV